MSESKSESNDHGVMIHTEEWLERQETLSQDDVEPCFNYLNKLIVGSKGYEARDYCVTLGQLIKKGLTPPKTVSKPQPPTLPTSASQLKASAFFAWSAYEETCLFCRKIIPARKTGHGIFMTYDYKKWCEACATDEHRKHPNYLKYKK